MGQPRCRMPVTASNFAILLRSGKNTAHRYAVALAELGIKAVVPQTENLLDTPEVASLYFRLSERQKNFPLYRFISGPVPMRINQRDLVSCPRFRKTCQTEKNSDHTIFKKFSGDRLIFPSAG